MDLPASAAQPTPKDDAPIFLTVLADLSLRLNEDTVTAQSLPSALEQLTQGDQDTRIFLRADKAVPYGELMEAMNALRDAGYLKVALVGLERASP